MNKKLLSILVSFIFSGIAFSQNNELNFSSAGSNYVNLNNFITEFNNSFTLEMWVKVPSGNTNVGLLYKDNGNGSWERGEKSLYIDGSGNPAFVGNWNGYIYSTQAVNDGNWHHIAVTYNGASNGKIYVDGIDRSNGGGYNSFSADNYSGSTTIYLGKPNYGESSYYFNGDMDEVRIWNVELSAANILANINKKTVGTESNMVAYYDFDQGIAGGNNTTITSLVDKTSYAYNGTLANFTETGSTSNFVSSTVSVSGTYAFVPLIAAVSSNTTVCSGVTTKMSVTATGTSLSYQWYRNSASIFGQTSATLTLTSALTTAPGTFSVVVSNSSGTVTSSGISLGIGCNNALQFNGNGFTGPYINVNANSNDFNLATFTFEAWINPTTGSNGNQTILSKGGGNGGIDNSYIFQVQSGTLQFYNSGASASPYWFNSGVSIPNDTWTHVAASYENTTLRLFVNGVNIYTTNVIFNLSAGTNDFYIGQQGYSCVCNKFYGQIDEVRVWNIALSGADIQANIFKSVVSTLPGLVASYSFNQGTAGGSNTGITTLTDVNNGLHNGILNSFSLSGSTANWISSAATITGSYAFATPAVTSISPSTTVCNGVATTFAVTAAGTSLTYQWLKNGSVISGATASTLTLTGVTSTSAGVYSVAISSLGGNITSSGITFGIGCNNALDFDGSSDYILVNQTSAVRNLGATGFTLSAWVYPTSGSGALSIFRKTNDYNLYINSGKIGVEVWTGGEAGSSFIQQNGTTTIPTNQWTQITAVWNGTNILLYINGALESSSSAGPFAVTGNENLCIGKSLTYNNYFVGKMDELYIWNKPLSQIDIQNNKNKKPNGTITGLVAYYDFDEGIPNGSNATVTTLNDNSGYSHAGTLNTFALSGASSNWVASGTTISGIFGFSPTTITGITSSQTVCSGVTLPLSVTVSGSVLAYQWYKNGAAISGATAAALTLTGVTSTSAGIYSVAISSLGGNITSAGISLGVGCNNALNFDGVDDYALISADIPGGNQFTFSTWFNASTATNNKILSSSGSLFEIALVNSNQVQVYTPYGDGTGGNIALNTWNHLAAVYNNPTMTVYLNGSVIYTFPVSGPINTISGLRIGRHFSVTYLNYVGLLDEMSFWNISLSQTDIQSLMSKSIVSSTTGLTAYYNFNQGLPSSDNSSITTLNDVSNNSRSGTLSNFTLNGSTSNFVTSTVSITGTFGFTAMSITGITSSQTVCSGLTIPLNVTISGASGATFQWYKNGALIAGATVSGLTLTAVTSSSAGVYSVAISSLGGNITSSGITLGVGCNNALNFDGTDDYIIAPNVFTTAPASFTVEFWLYPTVLINNNQGLGATNLWGAFAFHSALDGSVFTGTDLPNRFTNSDLPANTLQVNQWQHIAFTFSNGTGSFYKNGNLLASKTGMAVPGNWGGFSTNSSASGGINGNLDELRIWNVALSGNDIRNNIYKKASGTESNLVAYYDFDQGFVATGNSAVNSVTDRTSNGNNATVNNFSLNASTSNWVSSTLSITGVYAFVAPGITGITSSQTVCSGVTLPLNVTISGGGGATYQWYKNGAAISGATVSGLTLAGIASTSAGVYSVAISSLGGNITSSGISLGVGCNNALDFDGANDAVSIIDNAQLDFTNQYTFEAWINVQNYQYGTIVSKFEDDGNNRGWMINMGETGDNTKLCVTHSNSDWSNHIQWGSDFTPALNTWYHIAVVFDENLPSNQIKLYVNGVLTDQVSSSVVMTPNAANVYLGGYDGAGNGLNAGANSRFFDGDMDETRIWNIALSAVDIANNYTKRTLGNETGLVAYYDFNEGIAAGLNPGTSILLNKTSNSEDGTLNGFNLSGPASNWISSAVSISGTYSFALPGITGISAPQAVCSGVSSTTLSVTATGSGLTYQWYKDNVSISGQTFATLTLSGITTTSGGNYFAIVSGLGGIVTSSGIALTMGCNNALNFDGVDDYVFVGNPASLNFNNTDKFSIQLWFRTSSAAQKVFFSKLTNTAPYNGYEAYIGGGKIGLFLCSNFSTANYFGVTSTNTYNDNNWHQATFVYKGVPNSSGIELYVDGVLETNILSGTTLTGSIANANNVHIGARGNVGQSLLLPGSIDDLRIWNRALSPSEIQNYENCELISTITGLVAYYNFNSGVANSDNTSVNLLTDLSGNNTDGSLINFALNGAISNWATGSTSVSGNCNYVDPRIQLTGNNIALLNGDIASTGTGTDFGNISTGTSMEQSFTINNISGNGNLIISSISISGINASDFSVVTVPSTIVNQGGNTTFNISFDPATPCDKNAIANIYTNDFANPVFSFALKGYGQIQNPVVGASPASICGSGSTSINLTSSEPGVLYYLRDNADNSVISGPLTGTGSNLNFNTGLLSSTTSYNILATVAGSCASSLSPVVTVNILSIPGIGVNASANSICLGKSVTLTGTGASTYTFTGGVLNGVGFIPTITGVYSVTGTSASGCTNTSFTTITVNSLPATGIISSANTVCQGATVTLSGTGASTYTFTGGVFNGAGFIPTVTGAYTVTGVDSFGCAAKSFTTITVNSLPNVSINVSDNSVCIGQPVTLTGAGASSYTFTGGVLSGIGFTPAISGTYSVSGTNALGCTNNSFATITVNSFPTVGINASSTVVCLGDPVTLSGTGAVSYSWTGGVTNGVGFVPSISRSYTVAGSNSAGCANTSVVSVTVNALPVVEANASSGAVCLGDMVTLSGTGAISYSWSGGVVDGQGFVPVVTDIYTVTGTNASGCSKSSAITITVNSLPNVSINASSNNLCTGQSVTLSGTGAVTYIFTGGVLNGVGFVPTITGTYSVTGIDLLGCINSSYTSVTVNPELIVGISPSANPVCFGQPLTLTGTGATTYTFTGGALNGVGFIPTVSGTYSVTGSSGLNCSNNSFITITVNSLPIVGADVSTDEICYGQTVTFSGTGAVSYSWSDGIQDGQTYMPVLTNTYTVTGTDGLGCSDIAAITVTVNSLPGVAVNASAGSVCIGQSVTLSGTGAVTYTFTGNVMDGVGFSPTITGIYSVTGTDGLGCMNSAYATITVNSLPIVDITASANAICIGQSVTLSGTGASSYVYTNGVSNGAGFVPTITGSYSATGTDNAGCSATASITVTVNSLPIVGINASANAVCDGQSLTLSGTGALNYTWTGGVLDGSGFVPLITTDYSVTGINAEGCTNAAAQTITVNGAVTLGSLSAVDAVYKMPFNETVSVTGLSPFTFAVISGSLPQGMALNTLTGAISGTSSVVGIDNFTIYAGNGTCSDVKSYLIQTGKADLIVKADDASKYPAQPMPTLYTSSVSGLATGEILNFTYSNTATASSNAGDYVVGVTVTGTTLGNYNLTVIPGTFTILQPSGLTVTATNLSKIYGADLPTFLGVIKGLAPGDTVTATYLTDAIPASPVGNNYKIYPVVSGTHIYKYDVTTVSGTLIIKPKRLTIKAFDYIVLAGQSIPTTFPGTVTGLIDGDSIAIVNTSDITTSTALGTYLITPEVSGEGLSNYSLIMFPGNLYVKYGLTITAANLSKVYGTPGAPFTGTISGLHTGDTLVTVAYTSNAPVNQGVGSYVVTPDLSGADIDKYALTTVAGSFIVYPAGLTVTAHNLTKKEKDPNPVFTSVVEGLVTGEAININYYTTADTSSPPGIYTVLPLPAGIALANYTLTTIAGTLTVVSTTSPMNIRLRSFAKVYGNPNPVFAGTETITGKTIGDDVQINYYATAFDTVGIYPLLVSISGANAGKYVINIQSGSFTVTKAPLIAKANSYTKLYGDPLPQMTGTITGLVNGDVVATSYFTDAATVSDVGEYSTVPYLSGSGVLKNYNITTVTGILTIEKAVLTVIGASTSKVYNERNPAFAYNIFGFVNGDNIQVLNRTPLSLTEATSFSDAGLYTISFTGASDNNYDFVYVNSTLTITPATQHLIGFNTQSIKVRTGESITLTGYASSGLPLSIQSDDTTIISIKDQVAYGLSDGVTRINISQSGNVNYTASAPIQIEATSTSTGILSVEVLGVLGPESVSPGKAVTYSLPLKAGYTYLWKYTGKNIKWQSDTTSYQVQVIFYPDTADQGQVIGQMFDSDGNLVKKDGFNVVINNSPEAQLSQSLAENKCAPLVTDCKNSYISSFNFGKLVNRTNGCSNAGYGDFTASGKIDTLLMGNSYHLVAKGYVKGIKSIYFAVWIDYANDGSFTETDDFISASFDADTIFEIKNVVIRNNEAYLGPRRMRVGMRTSGAFTQSDACMAEGISGEMEDYLVFIRAQDALEAPGIITPNEDGKNDLFIIRGINSKADNKLTISDRWGQKKFEMDNYDNSWGGTDSEGKKLDDGTYFYSFVNGKATIRGYVQVKSN